MLPVYQSQLSVFNYDSIPPGYYYQAMLTGRPSQRFWHRKKFESVAAMILPSSKVLDLGCGPGSFLSILGKKDGVFGVGLDIASSQIKFARETIQPMFPAGQLQFIAVEPGQYKLPFPDHSFDAVTCIEVIEHIHPFLAAEWLREARRVLRPTGRMLVTTPNYRSLWPIFEMGLERLGPVQYHDQHISRFTPNSLVKFMEAAGFELVDISSIFVVAPFLAEISLGLAEFCHRIEHPSFLKIGSLLVGNFRVFQPHAK